MRRSQRVRRRSVAAIPSDPRSANIAVSASEAAGHDGIGAGTVLSGALLPLRLFFGATFLYAGLDKLLDPSFFDPSSPASIHAQLAVFVRESPLGGIVQAAEPLATLVGLLIAIAEIGIGIGALSGLAFRLAAVGGAALSVLFWLTASWSTHPYYYGPDLPYAAGWLTLALAGHGGRLVPRRLLAFVERPDERRLIDRPGRAGWDRRPADPAGPASRERRLLLQGGLLAFAALAVGSLAVPLRLLGVETETGPRPSGGPRVAGPGVATGPSPTPFAPTPTAPPPSAPSQAPTASPASSPPAPSASRASDLAIATVGDVQRQGAVTFRVPLDAPASLPAGDPGIVVGLPDGRFVAFDAVCTHAGCIVEWDAPDRVLFCPCHGAAYDPANDAAVLGGPTRQPLLGLPISIDSATGRIVLQG